MSRYKPHTILALATLLLVAGCSESAETAKPGESIAEASVSPEKPEAALADGAYCFRNATTGDGVTDVAELLFTVTGDRAAGDYNWLPQEKDQRRGKFTGPISGNRIAASYKFSQEGQTTGADLTITVDETQVTIEGGAPELGLSTVLEKVDC